MFKIAASLEHTMTGSLKFYRTEQVAEKRNKYITDYLVERQNQIESLRPFQQYFKLSRSVAQPGYS